MQYTRLGNTGLIVSRLSFGVMSGKYTRENPTAPTPLYPQWFQEKTLDAKQKEAVGQQC